MSRTRGKNRVQGMLGRPVSEIFKIYKIVRLSPNHSFHTKIIPSCFKKARPLEPQRARRAEPGGERQEGAGDHGRQHPADGHGEPQAGRPMPLGVPLTAGTGRDWLIDK